LISSMLRPAGTAGAAGAAGFGGWGTSVIG